MVEKVFIQLKFQGLDLEVQKDEKYEWLLETNLVAKGYDVVPSAVLNHKMRKVDELFEGQHWVSQSVITSGGKQTKIFWTKEGVIYLGFFIRSVRAKQFRKWASQLILNHIEKKENLTLSALETQISELKALLQQSALAQRETSLAYADAVYTMLHERLQNLEAKFRLPSIDARIAYVYLMRIVGTQECKIGKSIKPLERLLNFEQAGVSLELLATIEFSSEKLAFSAEKFLHLIFKEKHLKGEWFLLEESDIALFLQLSEIFANWR